MIWSLRCKYYLYFYIVLLFFIFRCSWNTQKEYVEDFDGICVDMLCDTQTIPNQPLEEFEWVDITSPLITSFPNSAQTIKPIFISFLSNENHVTIYYTLDGTLPTENSTSLKLDSRERGLWIKQTTHLRYFAKDKSGNKTALHTSYYTIISEPYTMTGDVDSYILNIKDEEWVFVTSRSKIPCINLWKSFQKFFPQVLLLRSSTQMSINGAPYLEQEDINTNECSLLTAWNTIQLFNVDSKQVEQSLTFKVYRDDAPTYTHFNILKSDNNISKIITLFSEEKSQIYYRTYSSKDYTLYQNPIELNNSAVLEYYSIDLADNIESTKKVFIDIQFPKLEPPTFILPKMGEYILRSNILVTWRYEKSSLLSEPILYELEVSSDMSFDKNILYKRSNIQGNKVEFDLDFTGDVYIRMRVHNGSSISAYNEPYMFFINKAPYDINNDGLSDIAITSIEHSVQNISYRVVSIYYGSSEFEGIPSIKIIDEENKVSSFGDKIKIIEDINGDGASEILITSPFYSDNLYKRGRVYFFWGGKYLKHKCNDSYRVTETCQIKSNQADFSISGEREYEYFASDLISVYEGGQRLSLFISSRGYDVNGITNAGKICEYSIKDSIFLKRYCVYGAVDYAQLGASMFFFRGNYHLDRKPHIISTIDTEFVGLFEYSILPLHDEGSFHLSMISQYLKLYYFADFNYDGYLDRLLYNKQIFSLDLFWGSSEWNIWESSQYLEKDIPNNVSTLKALSRTGKADLSYWIVCDDTIGINYISFVGMCIVYTFNVEDKLFSSFRIWGEGEKAYFGSVVKNIGDFNGDKKHDFIIASSKFSRNKYLHAGVVYIICGVSVLKNWSTLGDIGRYTLYGNQHHNVLGVAVSGD